MFVRLLKTPAASSIHHRQSFPTRWMIPPNAELCTWCHSHAHGRKHQIVTVCVLWGNRNKCSCIVMIHYFMSAHFPLPFGDLISFLMSSNVGRDQRDVWCWGCYNLIRWSHGSFSAGPTITRSSMLQPKKYINIYIPQPRFHTNSIERWYHYISIYIYIYIYIYLDIYIQGFCCTSYQSARHRGDIIVPLVLWIWKRIGQESIDCSRVIQVQLSNI